MKRNPILPVILALVTFALLAVALWPQEEPTVPVVVAAVDLGAGTLLTPADLKTMVMSLESAPADSINDPTLLVGQSLAVVRYAGEPVTPRHLGSAVVLAPDERGIAVRVAADTGLAGLLRPGMRVGVVATLPLATGQEEALFAKSTLEGLRVLYVPPSFQARPLSAQTYPAEDGVYAPPPPEPASEGVIVLAAGTLPEPVLYETPDAILKRTLAEGEEPADAPTPPAVTWAVPVELLAALNAAGASFTLVLVPEDALPYTTSGFDVTALTEQPLASGH